MSAHGCVWETVPIGSAGSVAEEWDELNAESANMPFLDLQPTMIACREFGTGRERLVLCRQGARLVAAAAVTPGGPASWESFQPSQVPLGIWLQRSTVDGPSLVQDLWRSLSGVAVMFSVTRLDPDINTRPPDSALVETRDYIETARVSVRSSFDDYWAARGSNLRQNLRKQRKRLMKDGVEVRLEKIDSAAEIREAVDDYGKLESRGWKGSEGTALHPNNAQGRFYRDVFHCCAQKGEARIYRYFFGDRLVASDLCVIRDGVLTILKTTFDASDNRLSPSLLMKEEMLREMFSDERTKRIEFYGRVMDWHRRFTDEIRTLYHVNHFRWAWLGRARLLARRRRTSEAEPETIGPAS